LECRAAMGRACLGLQRRGRAGVRSILLASLLRSTEFEGYDEEETVMVKGLGTQFRLTLAGWCTAQT
jgi:hypothetical protein